MQDSEYLHMYAEEENHWWYAGMRAVIGALLKSLPPIGSFRALDAGCGTGYNLGWFRNEYAAKVIGADYSSCGLALCRNRGERDLVRADVALLPFVGGAFDMVISFDVLSEVKEEHQRVLALHEFLRVLKTGGILLVRVPAYEWLRSSHDAGVSTHHRFGSRELRTAVTRAGFQPLRATFANTLLFPLAVLWRVFKKAGLAPAGSDVRPATRGASWMNSALLRTLQAEAAILRSGRRDFPFGLSLFLLARKPSRDELSGTPT
jgi:SAM-dependent methyltransferase